MISVLYKKFAPRDCGRTGFCLCGVAEQHTPQPDFLDEAVNLFHGFSLALRLRARRGSAALFGCLCLCPFAGASYASGARH